MSGRLHSEEEPSVSSTARPTRQRSLVARLIRSAIFWALPILVMTAISLTWLYRSSAYRLFDEPLINAVKSLIATAEVVPLENDIKIIGLQQEPIDPRYQRALSGRYWLIGTFDEAQKILPARASRSLSGETLVLPQSAAEQLIANPGAEISAQTTGPDGEPLRVAARYVTLPNMETEPVVILAAADSRAATRAIRWFALIATGLMLLLISALIIGVYTQVRLGLKPLFELRERVTQIRQGTATRVEGEFPAEIQPLATELNSLIDHNIDVVERARTHVGNLAHALKTPLAVLMNESYMSEVEGETTASEKSLAELVGRQTEIMRNQVDHHLRRARVAARGQTIGMSTEIESVVSSLSRTLPRIYRSKDVDITVTMEPELNFRGEKRDLDEMVGNLMDNACKWATAKVGVRVALDPMNENLAVITVDDDGPGLPEESFAAALKRGVRLDETTPGTGFGLAIVDDLARAYKGSLTLGQASLGGLSVTLRLPCRKGPAV